MPRVENCGDNVDRWYEEEQEGGSSTHDVCRGCANDLRRDPHHHDESLKPYNGDPEGDAGWANEGCEHPDYADEDYRCEVCNAKLGSRDD